MSTEAWTDALDAIERRIADQRAALDALDADDAGDLPPFEPMRDIGPLPPELADRARALLEESRDVEAELAGALTHIGQDLQVVRTISASAGRSPAVRFIDTAL